MAALSEGNEDRMAAAYKARNQQDRRHPMLIHIEDGRLMPNVPRLGGRKAIRDANGKIVEPAIPPNPMYRVYQGDPKAPKAERLRVLNEGLRAHAAPIVDPTFITSTAAAFDIATANAEELVAFANQQYGLSLNANTPIHLLRGRVKKAAEREGDLKQPAAAAGMGAALADAGNEDAEDGLG